MKKFLLTIFYLLFFIFSLTLFGCTKTDVDVDLENARKNEELLTKEDYEELDKDPEFKEDYIEELVKADEEAKINEDYALVTELEEAEEDKKTHKGVKGSCDAIAESSTCLEFYGSFWNETSMKEQCEGAGTFSTKPCPNDMFGGCNTGVGTMADMVARMYFRGGEQIEAEDVQYAQKACDSTIISNWITP